MAQGRVEKAREIAAEAVRRPSVDFDTLMQIGLQAAQQEWYQEAAQVFGRCVKEKPASFEAHYNLALANFALQKYADALAAISGGPRAVGPQVPAREYLTGKIYAALGKAQAEQHLQAAFNGAPRQENYALDLSVFYLRRGAYPQAIATLERAAQYHPSSPFVALALSLAHVLASHWEVAVQRCEKLLKTEPAFAPARLLMAYALCMEGDYERCESVAAAGLAAANPHPYLYYVHAAALLKSNSKRYDQMLRELALASQSIPKCTLCYFTRSKVHEQLGNDRAAIADLETVVRDIDQGFAEAWYRLAILYQRSGRREDAAAARVKFRAIKQEQTDRESELLRSQFLPTLGDLSAPPNRQ